MRRRLGPLVALAMVALIGVGCSNPPTKTDSGSSPGSSRDNDTATSSGDNTAATPREQAVKFAECMRDNGVGDFPDPNASGPLTYDRIVNGSSPDPTSAAFKRAIGACKDLEPPGFMGGERSAQEQAAALEFAECIRNNGVTDFPDPASSEPLVDNRTALRRPGCDVSRGAPIAFRLETHIIDSSFITFIALVLSAIFVSIVLALRGKAMSWPERIGLFGLVFYFPFVLGLTLGGIPIDVGAVDPSGWRGWANLVPFGTIGPQLAAGLESDVRQLAGNLLILVPLGFGLPVVWQRFRRLALTLVAGFGVAFGIEFSQIVISLIVGVPYRVFDVDDLMLNTAGAIIGWVAWRVSLRLIPRANESPTGGYSHRGEARDT